MSDHDEFCRVAALPVLYKGVPVPCSCEEIRNARADERERIAQTIEAVHRQAAETDPEAEEYWGFWDEGMLYAARIARGGSDEA